jgi:hypothetical protein
MVMDKQLRTRLVNIIVWLVAEITLNLSGMDTIANYSEYVFGQEFSAASGVHIDVVIYW